MDKEEQETTPETEKTMEDLSPEVLTTILEHLTKKEKRNKMLPYRLVNSQWKDILDALLEKKVVSGEFPVFPAMKVGGPPTQLNVYCSLVVFGAAGSPFPANSLLLKGPTSFPEYPSDIQMDLRLFMTKFGVSLSSFALHNVIISPETLTRTLAPMSSLRVLRVEAVELSRPNIGPDMVLQAPPLPSLTSLEVNSGYRSRERDGKRYQVYIWLMASYADQLVGLNLKTGYPLPALQQRHQYYTYPSDSGETFPIASTSDSAFGKLKELTILQPTRDFLELSEFPSLESLSVTGLTLLHQHQAEMRNLVVFVEKCGQTLEKICFDISWSELVSEEAGPTIRLGLRRQQLLTAGVVAPKLKTLAIHYPSQDYQEWILSEELLVMFPVLEVLQLLNFEPHDFDKKYPVGQLVEGENQMGRAEDDVFALKERCTLLRQQMCDIQRNAAEFWDRVQAWRDFQEQPEPEVVAQRPLLAADAEEFQSGLITTRIERDRIFQRLADLGESREKVIVEQLLERRGVWNKCPNLGIVSVSTGRKPLGDLCFLQRLDCV